MNSMHIKLVFFYSDNISSLFTSDRYDLYFYCSKTRLSWQFWDWDFFYQKGLSEGYTPSSNLGYLAPQDNLQGCHIVHSDPLNAKRTWHGLCENALFPWQPIANLRMGGVPTKSPISRLLLILDY